MIVGTVSADYEAIIHLSILDVNSQTHEIDAVIDTGFNGSLTLPTATITALGLMWRSRGSTILANGMMEECDIYSGVVIWDGQPRNVLVLHKARMMMSRISRRRSVALDAKALRRTKATLAS